MTDHPLRNQRVHLAGSPSTTYTVRGPDAAGLLWLIAPGLPPVSLPVSEAPSRLVMAHPTPSAPPAPSTAPDLVAALTAHAGATIRARDLASTLLGRPATPVEVRQLLARVRALPSPLPIPGGALTITLARLHNARTLIVKKI